MDSADIVIQNATVEHEAMSNPSVVESQDEFDVWFATIRERAAKLDDPMSRPLELMCVCMPTDQQSPTQLLSATDPKYVVRFRTGPYEYLGPTASLGLPLFKRLVDDSGSQVADASASVFN